MGALPYPALLVLHILAVVVFLGGLFVVALLLPSLSKGADAGVLRRCRNWNRFVTTPALALVWLLGATLAYEGGWFVAGWLHVKIALVAVLSGLHGVQSARLNRLARGVASPRQSYAPALLTLVLAAAIFVLAAAKPF